MKKFVIGCLGVGIVAVVVAAAAGYYFLWRPARSYVASFQQLSEIASIESQIANQGPFTAPDSGELTETQVERFVKAADQMTARLGARAEALKAKYEAFEQQREGKGGEASITEMLGAFRDLADFFVEGKRAQVEALNQVQFSLDEYNWVKERVYAAAGLALAQIDITELGQATPGETPDLSVKESETGAEVPEQNRALVEAHLAKLKEYLALAFFGL